MSVVSLSLTGMGATQSSAQSTAPQVLPPVSIDAPQQRARGDDAPCGLVARRSAQHASRPGSRASGRVSASVTATTMGTTHTIGTPAPAYAGGQVAQGGTLGLLGNRSVMNVPVQHDELYVATDREPAGTNGGGYADQRCFGPRHHRAERVRRHAADPRLPRAVQATSV